MQTETRQDIEKRLLRMEALAEAYKQECYVIRTLIEKEGGVSTLPDRRPSLSPKELANVSAKMHKRIFGKNGKVASW
jgi:hypothetical protein